jgi:hypothetical protein
VEISIERNDEALIAQTFLQNCFIGRFSETNIADMPCIQAVRRQQIARILSSRFAAA